MRRPFLLLFSAACLLGVASSSALATANHAAAGPANSALPTISGTATSGQTLSATSGTWTGTAPIAYAYQWQRCNSAGSGCGAIGKETNQNYVASNADVGKTVRVQVTASNAEGSNQALSAATAAVVDTGSMPVSTKQPSPSGTAQEGQTVSTDNGTWTGSNPIAFTYQWQACGTGTICVDIAGATAKNFKVGAVQIGSSLRASVTGTNSIGKALTFSNLTAVVIAKAGLPVNTALPLISGSLSVGHTLQASTGTWTGTTTNGFRYQWTRCNSNGTGCANISGATGQSYGVGTADLGNGLRVSVTATNKTGSTSALSATSLIARAVLTNAGFSGVLRAGQEVTRPRGTSSRAIGHFTAKLAGRTLTWTLTFSHLTGRPTAVTLNKGLRGSNGPAFKTLCRYCYSPRHGTVTLTASQRDALLRGRTYVNVHTAKNRLGEIRTQINRVS